MLAIGRALMGRPSLLMLDEPSLGLAPIVIEQMFDRILELNKRTGLGVLLVEQNSAMAREIAARAFVLETGNDYAVRAGGSAGRRSAHSRGLSWGMTDFQRSKTAPLAPLAVGRGRGWGLWSVQPE
jgi:ABC-type multidrug transport system ATPase subunit